MKKSIFKIKSGLSIYVFLAILGASVSFASCDSNDTVEVQKNFPFEVAVMPVPKLVFSGQTVEIRISILRSGNYKGAKYSMRYFQNNGIGTLKYLNDRPFIPNDLYPIPAEEFRLYYVVSTDPVQVFDVWIKDNFGNEKKLSFQFSNKDQGPIIPL